jgi:uncharacterized protein YndB with AHSA1/START domain
MSELEHHLERTIRIGARTETVFAFFTDPERWAAWWGEGSTIDPRVGGRVRIRYPNGIEAGGEVLEISPPERIVFTYGYASGDPLPVGGSRVSLCLEATPEGTLLSLRHDLADAAVRDQHIQGWRYQLSVFANVVANEVNASLSAKVDGWLAAFSEHDDARREAGFRAVAMEKVSFRDRFSCVMGIADLIPHTAALQRFLPDVTLRREGDVGHCQGTAMAEWVAVAADGKEQARGTNVYRLDPDGRIASVTGLWR